MGEAADEGRWTRADSAEFRVALPALRLRVVVQVLGFVSKGGGCQRGNGEGLAGWATGRTLWTGRTAVSPIPSAKSKGRDDAAGQAGQREREGQGAGGSHELEDSEEEGCWWTSRGGREGEERECGCVALPSSPKRPLPPPTS